MLTCRRFATLLGVTVFHALSLFVSVAAQAQSLNVLPVTVQLGPGQRASALTIVNQSDADASFQMRAFGWSQASNGSETLTPSDEISVSPPLGTIPPGASQVVRIVLKPSLSGKENSYRLWLDQIPAPAAPGTVRIALRLSLPVFAEPMTRNAPLLRFSVERVTGQTYLVVVNDGNRHEKLQDVTLRSSDGTVFNVVKNISPYVLAGATQRWPVTGTPIVTDKTLKLTARAEAGSITDQVIAITVPP